MKDWLAILWLSLWMPVHTLGLRCRDARYYRHPGLWRVDWLLWRAYWWRDPYFLARREGGRLPVPSETLTYGTTPWVTVASLLQRLDARPGERFLELGAGDGRVAFFARLYAGLTVEAYELLPTFVRVAREIRQRLAVADLTFHQANLLEADLQTADLIYVAGTCLDDETISALEVRLCRLKPGARVVSLSYPFEVPGLAVVATVDIPVSWGRSTAYLQRMT